MSFSQTQVFAADGGVAESSQSGTPQGEGEVFFFNNIYAAAHIRYCQASFVNVVFILTNKWIS